MEFINFYNKNNGEFLAGYTAYSTFKGEAQATTETTELLAYENGIDVSDIEIKVEVK